MSVSARVHLERLNDGSVGYVIRGESKQTNKTKLLFCTTGVLLRRLSTGDDLSNVTHVIVDEVGERIKTHPFYY
jgi:ATP-dependent RNA helicase DHX57